MNLSQRFLIDEANFAGAAMAVVNADNIVTLSAQYSGDGNPMTTEQYVINRGIEKPRLMGVYEYLDFKEQWQHDTFLNDPPLEVSGAWFQKQMEILPPRDYERVGDMTRFNMCEFITGTVTTQYAQRGSLFLARNVDVLNRDTWITAADFDRLEAKHRARGDV